VKIFKISLGIIILFAVFYILGPTMPEPDFNTSLPKISDSVEKYVDSVEYESKVRPGNEARIIWASDTLKIRTEYVLLYLHGFAASWHEGYPANADFSKRYGCNAYFARLTSQGLISDNPLIDMTPSKLYESAKLALVIARQLGDKVIIMGTSTGGTLGLMLASDFPDMVYGLILYSPNIRIKQKTSFLLSRPWGLQIARLYFGGKFRVVRRDPSEEYCKFWYCRYRAEGAVYLQQLIDAKMNHDLFQKVKCPVFMGYYYKDSGNQDQIVSVSAALKMFDYLGTPPARKQSHPFPNAGDHVIASNITSHCVSEVEEATWNFSEKILKLYPVRDSLLRSLSGSVTQSYGE
jgi:pimeloyl-ACP methyl ester carboxylesterase